MRSTPWPATSAARHLTLSLERLAALCPAPPVRIGLSATQRPMDQIARFLVGTPAAGAWASREASRPGIAPLCPGH